MPAYEISHADPDMGKNKDGDWMGIGLLDFGQLSDAERTRITNTA